ncbi:MAG: type I polyketide synthase, partial [Caldilineaceae bacterium]|nr:type I polyketide synthase [Caldilineaceae bacterium]
TACSSSLVAVHQACQSLRRGECDGALVGGVNLIFNPEITSAFMQAGMLAADGRCKSFDARADGYVRSEGAGMVYLMRLADAQCQGHPIIAVIRGSAVNQDGRSNGLTAPNGAAQQRVIRAALQDAGVEPTEIGYVEAHGTGTSLGDPIEVHALKSVLLEDRTADQPCWFRTVKANIGHLEAAAGIAGFIKTALCLHHGQIPRQLHLQNINPHIKLSETPLRIPTSVQAWPLPDGPSYAGVSSFGFGGVNAHLILSAAPPVNRPASPIDRTHHLFTLAAKTAPALTKMAQAYAESLRACAEAASAESNYTESTRTKPVHGNVALDALCYTVNTGRAHFTHRLTVVTNDTTQLHAALSAVGSGQAPASVRLGTRAGIDDPAVTFLFSGQGAQNDAMGRQLYESAPIFRQAIDQCDQILRPLLGCSLVDLLYPPKLALPESRRGQLDQTVYTQPALFAVEYALAQLWLSLGIKPAVVMGHSSGEIVAACVAGAFTLADGLRLIVRRGQLMQSLSADGAMMVVFADEATVRGLLAPFPDQLAIAAINGDTHIVVAGACAAINQLEETLAAAGITHRALRASQAFHSPLMEPILTELAAEAALIDFQPLQIELVSTLTGRLLPVGYRFRAQHWRDHARQPVRFTQAVDLLIAQGQRHFLEIGPTPVLCGLGKRYVVDGTVDWLPSQNPHQADWKTFLDSLASLYLLGLPIEWQALYQPVAPPRLALPTYPFQRKRYWLDKGNCTMHTAGSDPIHAISPAPMLAAKKHEASASLVQSILRELRTMVAALLKI